MIFEPNVHNNLQKLAFKDNLDLVEKIREQLPDAEVFTMENPTDGIEATTFRMVTSIPVDAIESNFDLLLTELVTASVKYKQLYLYEMLECGVVKNAETGDLMQTFLFRGKFVT